MSARERRVSGKLTGVCGRDRCEGTESKSSVSRCEGVVLAGVSRCEGDAKERSVSRCPGEACCAAWMALRALTCQVTRRKRAEPHTGPLLKP